MRVKVPSAAALLLLAEHPILRDRGDDERVRRVLTFTGQSVSGPPDSASLQRLSKTAVEWQPNGPRVPKDGGDVRVDMESGVPLSAEGRAQAVALEAGGAASSSSATPGCCELRGRGAECGPG